MMVSKQNPKHPKAGLYLQRKLFDSISRFTDVEKRIADLPTPQERGDAFEVFVEAYLSTQAIGQVKTVWPFKVLPFEIKEQFGFGQSDMGVDGALVTHLGEYHAYQAKFRTGRPSLSWDELSTFMGLTDQIPQRVVITNCNELSQVIQDRRGFYCIRGTDFDRLHKADFEAITNWLAGAATDRITRPPLPRQQEALGAIQRTLVQHDRATLLMPCGSGKTLVSLWVAEQCGNSKILVLLPSLALIAQTIRAWIRDAHWERMSFLCVCSDPTVTDDTDRLVLHQSDLDFPVTTNSEAVLAFLGRQTGGVKVVFCTYQSAPVVGKAMEGGDLFDLGIFDEAHKTAGREGARFSFALLDKNIAIAKRLFMTATPRHYDVLRRDKEGDAKLVYSMDVPEVYGPIAYSLSFAEAVEQRMICDYKVLISVITSEMVNEELLCRGEVLVTGDVVKARQVANQMAVKDAIERLGIRKTITFHKSVRAAVSFTAGAAEGVASHIPGLGVFHVNGRMSGARRDTIMRSFAEGDCTLVSNARCLTEGVDVPAVDMVAFIEPKRSLIDIVQATGRAMRINPETNKTIGYVLLPLFVEQSTGETVEQAVSRANFSEVWDVLQALQEHDEILAETLKSARYSQVRQRKVADGSLDGKVEIFGPAVSLDALKQAITTRLIEPFSGVRKRWDSTYDSLVRFHKEHGRCDVSNLRSQHLLEEARWLEQQETALRLGKLRLDQVERLAKIGITWPPDWARMFPALKKFRHEHGHLNVYEDETHDTLAKWAKRVHSAFRAGKLQEEYQRALDGIGFSDYSPREVEFSCWLRRLNAFKEYHGHCNVPWNYSQDPELGGWVARTRENGIRHLNDYEGARLDALGFDWERDPWMCMYDACVEYKKIYGCFMPPDDKVDGVLAKWLSLQRVFVSSFRERLTDVQVELLKSLGVCVRYDEEMVAALETFKAQNGHCLVEQAFRLEYERQSEHLKNLEALCWVWGHSDHKLERAFRRIPHWLFVCWLYGVRGRDQSISDTLKERLQALGVWEGSRGLPYFF